MRYNVLTQMKAKSAGAGKYADGQGLWLFKRNRQFGKWIVRIVVGGKRREMGLGPWPDVSIAEARERAAAARRRVRDGVDPIAERQEARHAPKTVTVEEAIESCFASKKAELKGGGKPGRWLSPLANHVIPKLGKHPIEKLNQHHLREVLEPIWHDKPEMAAKALSRINLTLKHSVALGLDVDLQAAMKAKILLGKQRRETVHIPSLDYDKVPAFYGWLKSKDSASALALRFLILTAARTTEVRLASASEIEGDIWTLPPDRTKTGKEHRIPLAPQSLALAEEARSRSSSEYLFTSPTGKPLSNMAMAMLMRKNGFEARPHGFRASFRTWVEEQTDTSFEVKEAALGHAVDSGVVGAYQRSDRLEKRRVLMESWSDFLVGDGD